MGDRGRVDRVIEGGLRGWQKFRDMCFLVILECPLSGLWVIEGRLRG